MLLRQVLLELPDRPGSLGQVTTLLGRLGVDIRQMRVRGRDGRTATDEFTVAVPGAVVERTLASLLDEVEGVKVLSMWAIDAVDESSWSAVRAPTAN
jgi:ACT domain-containing protein